jgi:hypothetical protein
MQGGTTKQFGANLLNKGVPKPPFRYREGLQSPVGPMIKAQVHDKFKVFTGELAKDKTIGKLAEEVAAFARHSHVAAKSIGVEYIESAGRLLITLGYCDDKEPYPIKLHSVPLGKIGTLTTDFSKLEAAMAEASGKIRNIICHELYLTGDGDFVMVFMTHEQA